MAMNEVVQAAQEQLLGRRLQSARKKAGITQQELCTQANLSYSTLAKIERGAIKAPSIFTIQSIAAALHVTLDELVGEAASNKPPGKKTAKNGVRFIYFDINGCLVRFFHGAFTKLAEDAGAPADMVEATFWHYNDAVCRGDLSIDEFNAILSQKLSLEHVDWREYYLAAVEPITEMHQLVKTVAQEYHVGLLSNIMPGLIGTMRRQQLLPDIGYSQIIDSSEVGAIKPEELIYDIASQRAGVRPEEILLVDDSRSNLMAAEHAGWHVLWFDDYRPGDSVTRIREILE